MADRFARVVVAARVPIVIGWIVAAVAVTMLLPSINEAQVGAWAIWCRPAQRRSKPRNARRSSSCFRF